jgi:hypothetical protein
MIYRPGADDEMAPLGNLALVKNAMRGAFPELEWRSATECGLYVDGGFIVEWTVNGEEVSDGYTNGGYNHLRELAVLCKKMGWRIADAQEGEDIDLDHPYASFGGENSE